MRENTLNMTQGNPTRLLISFSIPMLIGNLFQQAYNLVDSVIVGKYVGADAFGAIGATSSVSFLFFALCNGISSGGGIIASQYYGAAEKDKVKKAMANAAYISIIISLLVGTIAYITSGAVLRLLRTPDELMQDALIYMHMQCIGVPLIAVYNYASAMLRALGDSKGPLYFLIFACALNIGLDLLFVRGLNLSVFGAGLATIIAQFIAGFGCLIYAFKTNTYFRMERKNLRMDKTMIWKTVSLGVPLSIQYSLIAISCMGLQVVVNSFGPIAVAAFTATSRIEQILHQPYNSLGTALSTYSGQNKGAKLNDRILLGFRKSLVMMGVFSIIMLPIMQFFGENIVRMFVEETEVIQMGAKALRITSWFYFTLGLIYITRGVLNGVGDAIFALINGIVEVVCRMILPVILTMIPLIGVWGIWYASGIIWAISALFCMLRYFWWKKSLTKIA